MYLFLNLNGFIFIIKSLVRLSGANTSFNKPQSQQSLINVTKRVENKNSFVSNEINVWDKYIEMKFKNSTLS